MVNVLVTVLNMISQSKYLIYSLFILYYMVSFLYFTFFVVVVVPSQHNQARSGVRFINSPGGYRFGMERRGIEMVDLSEAGDMMLFIHHYTIQFYVTVVK